ncbi:myb-like protein U [Microplitis mediator]|uniref:myb-like protein U n=1 Tax=Microplitis mediator TaxID=375433 RepID=UPI002556DCAA|nr:myb-like protein U [Microplitis mediator]
MKMKGDSGKPGKRPIKALTTHEKIIAIERVHSGESKASVARDIGVPESTLRGWCKSEEKIRGLARNSSPSSNERTSPLSVTSNSASVPTVNTYYSEDNGPVAKKIKTDHQSSRVPSAYGINENLENNARATSNMSHTEAAQLAAAMARIKEDPTMLLQGMNVPYFMSQYASIYEYSMREAARLKNNNNNNNISASLVANGLQYSFCNKNKSISGTAKSNRTHALNYGRKSLPSSLEDQTTLVSVSPRESPELGRQSKSKIRNPVLNNQARNYSTNFNNNNIIAPNDNNNLFGSKNNNFAGNNNDNIQNNNNSYGLNDPMSRYKPAQQQPLGMTPTAEVNPKNMSQQMQLYNWYQSLANGVQPAVTSAPTPAGNSSPITTPTSTLAKKPLTKKTRATLDQLFSNNSVNVMSSIDATAGGANEDAGKEPARDSDKEDDDEENKPGPIDKVEAIKHAKKFMSYLTKTMDPNVTWTQIRQFEKLVEQVENAGSKLTPKQVRKNSTVVRHSASALELSVKSE